LAEYCKLRIIYHRQRIRSIHAVDFLNPGPFPCGGKRAVDQSLKRSSHQALTPSAVHFFLTSDDGEPAVDDVPPNGAAGTAGF
jgi:hypothetical protein